MPEVSEVAITSQYLLCKLKNRNMTFVKVLDGKYLNGIPGEELIRNKKLTVNYIDSYGKFMWFEFENNFYLLNTFGLDGYWSFEKMSDARIEFDVDTEKNKKYKLYYCDKSSYGNLQFVDSYDKIQSKINKLAPDALKTKFTCNDFKKLCDSLKTNIKKKKIIEILMSQEKNKGIVSGLGNYLSVEILYDAKISPIRLFNSLSDSELNKLCKSIKKIVKMSYANNNVGYMIIFGKYIDKHKSCIGKSRPNYHPEIKITEPFSFKVYRQKKDPFGNVVQMSKIVKNRTTYWVPDIQK